MTASATNWIFAHDLRGDIPGRSDSDAEKQACIDYLAMRSALGTKGDFKSISVQARRVVAEVAAARVVAVATARARDVDLEARLVAADRTIDRLLAFVPSRAEAINVQRLRELVAVTVAAARRAFPDVRGLETLLLDETDTESSACHVLSLTPELSNDVDGVVLAQGVRAVHRALVEASTPAERAAIRLTVEPRTNDQ